MQRPICKISVWATQVVCCKFVEQLNQNFSFEELPVSMMPTEINICLLARVVNSISKRNVAV
jgi:hypothetical protein